MGQVVVSPAFLMGFFYPMAKDPAFLFYSSDFLTGTMFMSNEQVGLFIRMLCAQHQHGGRINTKELRTQCERIANGDAVYDKFKHDHAGSYNERLAYEMGIRKEKGIKARQSANKRWKNPNKQLCEGNANALRSESESESESINEYINKSSEIENPILWTSAKNSFLNSDEWKYQFCTSKKVSKAKLEKYMDEFIADCELKTDYKDLKELKKHFTNWFNLKNKSNGKGLSEVSQQRQDAYAEYVNRHRE